MNTNTNTNTNSNTNSNTNQIIIEDVKDSAITWIRKKIIKIIVSGFLGCIFAFFTFNSASDNHTTPKTVTSSFIHWQSINTIDINTNAGTKHIDFGFDLTKDAKKGFNIVTKTKVNINKAI